MLQGIIDSVYLRNSDAQRTILTKIAENIRGINEILIPRVVDDWYNNGMFFVPNDRYLRDTVGEWISNPIHGLYNFDRCRLAERLAMPMRTLSGEVIGFIGYSNQGETSDISFIKYLYPSAETFNKGNYIYLEKEEWLRAYDEQVIAIVDGLFDKRMLNMIGIPACSLCGSNLTEYHKLYLSRIKHKVIIADNDNAGRKLALTCKNELGAVEMIHASTKDIDGLIATGKYIDNILDCWNTMKLQNFIISQIIKL